MGKEENNGKLKSSNGKERIPVKFQSQYSKIPLFQYSSM